MIFLASLWNGTRFCLKLIAVLVPLLVLYEMASTARPFRKDSPLLRKIAGFLGISPAAGAPLLAGFFLGIAYGAGIIIPVSKERNLSKRDVLGVGLFLCTCHAVIEDTLLFVLAGASGLWLVGIRLALAVLIVSVAARFVFPRLEPEGAP